MNILLASVGRRSYLVQYFKQALYGRGQVICANMYADTAAMHVADKAIVVPVSHDSRYISSILEICNKYQIKMIFSFHDLDVYILSQHLEEIRRTGAIPVLPDAQWGRIALDKYECNNLLKDQGFNVPWTSCHLSEALKALNENTLELPVLVKARLGFGSQGLQRCDSSEELQWAYVKAREQVTSLDTWYHSTLNLEDNVLIQALIKGREYHINVVNDLSGQYVCHFMCEVHSMRAGESDRATTVDPALVGDLPVRLSALTKHPGIWGIDCMEDNGVLRIIDINPRFAGEYPFFHLAGANIPAAMIAWAEGLQPDPEWLKASIGIKGYKDIVPVRIPQ